MTGPDCVNWAIGMQPPLKVPKSMENDEDLGYLIVGHGTRDLTGQEQMRTVARQTAALLSPIPTELAFLELAEPTIEEGVSALANRGVRRLVTLPVLLFRARHADHDIPEAVKEAAAKHGIAVVGQANPLELQVPVLELSAARFREALAQRGLESTPRNRIALAMIARGSSSQAAAYRMGEFACERHRWEPVSWCGIGYVAVRHPNVSEILNELSLQDADVLVVQPHLLFSGEVWHSIDQQVQQLAANDRRPWVITQPLGSGAAVLANSDEIRTDSRNQPSNESQSLGSVLAQLGRNLTAELLHP